uniref:Uncharacterized protein n=1 Tax=Manihot esculenta TaxID=3983 RepID=A0A2C9U0W3_MANES
MSFATFTSSFFPLYSYQSIQRMWHGLYVQTSVVAHPLSILIFHIIHTFTPCLK